MSLPGTETDRIWFDEAGNINQHTLDALQYGMPAFAMNDMMRRAGKSITLSSFKAVNDAPAHPALKPIEIPCASCGAAAGERCNRGTDPRTGHKRFRGYHRRRKNDALLVDQARRALTKTAEPDTVTFRWRPNL